MSSQETVRFFDQLATDEDLRNEYWGAVEGVTVAATVELAASKGFVFTADELRSELESQSTDLSEDELEAVAGGAQPTLGASQTPDRMHPQGRFLGLIAEKYRGR